MGQNKIGIGSFDQLLGRAFSVPQPEGGICPEFSPEISPVIVLENDRAEWCYLKNEKCCAANVNVPANAGQIGMVRFRNPTTSGALMVITNINVSPVSVAALMLVIITLGKAAGDLATGSGTKEARDSRLFGNKPSALLTYDNTGAAASGTTVEFGSSSQGFYQASSPPFVVAPGGSVDIQLNVSNLQAFFNLQWSERELRRYEQ